MNYNTSETADAYINLKYDGLQQKLYVYIFGEPVCAIIGDDGIFSLELVTL